MKLKKMYLLLMYFTSIGLFAVDGPTVKNMFKSNIKIHLLDSNEKIYESREVSYNSSVTMTRCVLGRIVAVEWGEKESDGSAKIVASILDNCKVRLIFNSNKELVLEKEMNLNKFVPK